MTNLESKGCSEPDCHLSAAGQLYDGRSYCRAHDRSRILEDVNRQFDDWQPPAEPSPRFRYLVGRVVGEQLWESKGDSYLSAARIRDRGFSFQKADQSFTFEIVRHPGAVRDGCVSIRVTQKWKGDLAEKCITLVDTRDFREGDID